jgi:hypothetical protein
VRAHAITNVRKRPKPLAPPLASELNHLSALSKPKPKPALPRPLAPLAQLQVRSVCTRFTTGFTSTKGQILTQKLQAPLAHAAGRYSVYLLYWLQKSTSSDAALRASARRGGGGGGHALSRASKRLGDMGRRGGGRSALRFLVYLLYYLH